MGERGCVALCGISADRNSCLDMSSWLLSSHWLVTEASVLHTIRPGLDGLLLSQFCYRPPIFSIVKSFVSYAYRSGTICIVTAVVGTQIIFTSSTSPDSHPEASFLLYALCIWRGGPISVGNID